MVSDTKIDNVYVIDTNMFGFPNYQSCYLVEGEELVLIDTGLPSEIDSLYSGIERHGFSIDNISKIILTHCEHPDHAGNVGTLVKENPDIQVFIHPEGFEYLTEPSIESENRKKVMLPQMAARFGEQIPVPSSRICFLKNGQIFDLGNNVRLRIMCTSGHQPSGLIIFDEKNNGVFINDLVGNYFADADFSLVLTPPRSDVIETKNTLQYLMKLSISRFYLGHYGITQDPKTVMQRVLEGIERIMSIAAECVKKGKPDGIAPRVIASKMPEIEKLRKTRGETLYEYVRDELITHHSTYFAQYYLERFQNIN